MKWSVKKSDKGWMVYDTQGTPYDEFGTHAEAMIWAHRYVVADGIFGGWLKYWWFVKELLFS